jgi:hypothetical protein
VRGERARDATLTSRNQAGVRRPAAEVLAGLGRPKPQMSPSFSPA